MQTHKNEEEFQDRLPPELERMKGENPYSVPPRYFMELPDKVMERIRREDQESTVWELFLDRVADLVAPQNRKGIALAFASVTTLAVAVVWVIPAEYSGAQMTAISQISAEEAYTYAMENIEEFSSEQLYMLSSEEELQVSVLHDASDEEVNIIIDDILEDMDPEIMEAIF